MAGDVQEAGVEATAGGQFQPVAVIAEQVDGDVGGVAQVRQRFHGFAQDVVEFERSVDAVRQLVDDAQAVVAFDEGTARFEQCGLGRLVGAEVGRNAEETFDAAVRRVQRADREAHRKAAAVAADVGPFTFVSFAAPGAGDEGLESGLEGDAQFPPQLGGAQRHFGGVVETLGGACPIISSAR